MTTPRTASPWLLIVTVCLPLGVIFGLMCSFSVFLGPLLAGASFDVTRSFPARN